MIIFWPLLSSLPSGPKINRQVGACLVSQNGVILEIKVPRSLGDKVSKLYMTMFPCNECAKVLIQCPDTNYLFMSDYVDRGYYSVETVTGNENNGYQINHSP